MAVSSSAGSARCHPQASVLRQRAADLRALARAIEQSLVMTLVGDDWPPEHVRRLSLNEALLAGILRQLHQAADDLRDTAFRFAAGADELDLAARGRVA